MIMIKTLKELNIICSLDVESYGLYGNSFSYGMVIGDSKGNVLEEIYKFSQDNLEQSSNFQPECDVPYDNETIEWMKVNVLPYRRI